jgi:uncharacterized protein (TIGR02328 family)
MRLWHEKLIPYLSQQRLQGQHRECCCGRGNVWGTKQGVMQYVYRHSPAKLAVYHFIVMDYAIAMGINIDRTWYDPTFRGYYCGPRTDNDRFRSELRAAIDRIRAGVPVYEEHDDEYLQWCLSLLHLRRDWIKKGSRFEEAVRLYGRYDFTSQVVSQGERY